MEYYFCIILFPVDVNIESVWYVIAGVLVKKKLLVAFCFTLRGVEDYFRISFDVIMLIFLQKQLIHSDNADLVPGHAVDY